MGQRPDWDKLLVEARSGNSRALAALLEAARNDLQAAVAGVLGKSAQRELPSDDLFEEAMLAALRELRSLRAVNYLGFRVWFATIARNYVCRMMRRRRGRPRELAESGLDEIDPVDPAPSPAGENPHCMLGAVQRLPPSQLAAFVLREGLRLSWETIGFVLERRGTPATRLIHYRATRVVRHSFELRTDPQLFAFQALDSLP